MSNLYVPVDPTDEMLDAAVKGTRANISYEDARAIYEAMTEVAPKVKREEHFVLHFESTRNGIKDDQPRMQGIQAFPTITKAIEFMIKGLRIDQRFQKMTRVETFRTDVSHHLREVAAVEGVEVKDPEVSPSSPAPASA